MSIFRVLGALYLIYLDWILLKSKSTDSEIMIVDDDQPLNKWNAFRMGFMTNVLNPKATIFFLSIFTTLVSITTPIKIQVFYGIWMCAVNALWFMVVALLFSYSYIRHQFLKKMNLFEKFMGVILIVLAFTLLLKN